MFWMNWSAVIFDMDGLMIDSEPIALEVWRDLVAEYDRELTDELYRQVIGEEPLFGVQVIRTALKLPLGEQELLDEYWRRRILVMCKKVGPAPGLIELLELLHGCSVQLGLASNSPCGYVEAVSKALGIFHYFNCIRSSEDVPRGKPAPDIYTSALDCMQVAGSEALALEDSPAGIAAAKAAGLTCFAVPNDELAQGDFSSADLIFSSLLEVKDYLYSVLKPT
jgi:beta-phosphoglucomutase-like phosphatase (HAD superfamily)